MTRHQYRRWPNPAEYYPDIQITSYWPSVMIVNHCIAPAVNVEFEENVVPYPGRITYYWGQPLVKSNGLKWDYGVFIVPGDRDWLLEMTQLIYLDKITNEWIWQVSVDLKKHSVLPVASGFHAEPYSGDRARSNAPWSLPATVQLYPTWIPDQSLTVGIWPVDYCSMWQLDGASTDRA